MHNQSQTGPALSTVGLVTHKTYTIRRSTMLAALADTLQSSGLVPATKLPLRSNVIKPGEPVRASGVTSFAPIMPGKPMPAPEAPPLRGADANAAEGWQSGEAPAEPP